MTTLKHRPTIIAVKLANAPSQSLKLTAASESKCTTLFQVAIDTSREVERLLNDYCPRFGWEGLIVVEESDMN